MPNRQGYDDDDGANNSSKRNNSLDFLQVFSTGLPKMPNKSMFFIVLALFVLLVGKSCFYTVPSSDEAVIKRFGKIVDITHAGLHFKLPYPIETVHRANVTEVHRMEIGYRDSQGKSASVDAESLMLTGDENIISIDFIIQYQIRDIVAYLFNLEDANATIQLAAEASIREIAGKATIDDLLTTGKETVQEETKQLMQNILNSYEAGVFISAVELQDIEPPAPVMNAFRDVASAREDKNRYINEAQAYENEMIPRARAQAATVMLEAESYGAQILRQAEGETKQFLQIYESYRKAPEISRKRMYIDAMAKIINSSEILVIDEKLKDLNLFTGMNGVLGEKSKLPAQKSESKEVE